MKKPMIIRPETDKDLQEIYILIQTSFETAKVKDGDEQDYAANLRKSKDYIPELALVAEQDGKLTGHIMLTKTNVYQPDGKTFPALLLAPLSVLLEYRNQGVGSALIRESFEKARQAGFTSVFLCGDPAYYKRFGFKTIREYGITNQHPEYIEYTLVAELEPNALQGIHGYVDYF